MADVAHGATLGYMPRTIAQRDLRNQSAAIMDAVSQGESFVVTRNGVPVAELRPISTPRKEVVSKAEIAAQFAGGPRLDARQFREDLDRLVDQGLN
jgi:prevent-host-death family protein